MDIRSNEPVEKLKHVALPSILVSDKASDTAHTHRVCAVADNAGRGPKSRSCGALEFSDRLNSKLETLAESVGCLQEKNRLPRCSNLC